MRTAIIGLGSISVNHVFAILQGGHEIVGVCDIEIEKCHKAIKENNLNAKAYVDYKQMLLELSPDVVHVCTPHYLHAEMIIFALNNNINVLSEKPMAINFQQLKEIEIAVKNSKAILGISQQNRYNPSVLYVKELLKGQKIISSYGTLFWNRDNAYYKQAEWRGKWATEGGGVMINQALHTLDLLQWFTGFPKTVIANISNNTHNGVIEVEDTAFALFKGDDFNFAISATNSMGHSFPVQLSFTTKDKNVIINGDNVIVNDEPITILSDKGAVVGKSVWGASHVTLVKDFYVKVKNGEKFPIDFYEAKQVIRLILAMYKSNGQEIQIR